MSRRKVPAATPSKCPLACLVCLRSCKAAQAQNHRFDCCGDIEAHEPWNGVWRRIRNPMRAGYLTGESKTRRPA